MAAITTYRRYQRGFSGRKVLLWCVMLAVLGVGIFSLAAWMRARSPGQLIAKAQIAFEQRDYERAVNFLTRALEGKPTGAAALRARVMLGRGLVYAGREGDARPHLLQVLAEKPDDTDAIAALAESYPHGPIRRLNSAVKPLTPPVFAELLQATESELAGLEKLPPALAGRPQVDTARAQLHRLYYLVCQQQAEHARSALTAGDSAATQTARDQLARLAELQYAQRGTEAYRLLAAARSKDPKNIRAAELLAIYHLDDAQRHAQDPTQRKAHFAEVLRVYDEMAQRQARSQELTVTAANAIMADDKTLPALGQRADGASKVLQDYLATDPRNARIMVAIGQIAMQRGDLSKAQKMADEASASAPGDLDAQMLRVTCQLALHKAHEALAVLTPLTSAHGNVPQVWNLRGTANLTLRNFKAAEDDFRRALTMAPNFGLARRNLLLTYTLQSRESQAAAQNAAALATKLIFEDRYYMPAWDVRVMSLRRENRLDDARRALRELAGDAGLPEESKPMLVRLLMSVDELETARTLLAGIKTEPSDTATVNLKADLLVAGGNITAARQMLAEAVTANPDNAALRLAYAEILLRVSMNLDARRELDQVAKRELSSDQALRLARAYVILRLPEPARVVVERVLKNESQNADALGLSARIASLVKGGTPDLTRLAGDESSVSDLVRLGAIAVQQKNYAQALTLARNGLARENANVPLRLIEARALFALKQVDEATDALATAAKAAPEASQPYEVLVELFQDDTRTGMAHAGKLAPHNQALANWAMGRLALRGRKFEQAGRYLEDALAAAGTSANPARTRELVYSAMERLAAQSQEDPGYSKAIDRLAADREYGVSLRIAAAEHFLTRGNPAAARDQLAKIDTPAAKLPGPLANLLATRWAGAGDPQRGLDIITARRDAQQPTMLALQATLLQQAGQSERALAVLAQLIKAEPTNPAHYLMQARVQAGAGDYPAALATLKACEGLGETAALAATTTRIAILTNLGLLQAAGEELQARGARFHAEDHAATLALGQSWLALGRMEEAQRVLRTIPRYAAEWPAAQIALAGIASDAGRHEEALRLLRELSEQLGSARASGVASPTVIALLRAGKTAEATKLALEYRAQAPANSPEQLTWTLMAAGAAREDRKYEAAAELIAGVRGGNADLALLHLLAGKNEAAAAAAEAAADRAPRFDRSFVRLLTRPETRPPAELVTSGSPAAVLAALAATPPAQWKDFAQQRTSMFRGDLSGIIAQAGTRPDAVNTVRQMALAQRLLEIGWHTNALDVLAKLEGKLAYVELQRYQALISLRRQREAEIGREQLARQEGALPSIRMLLAQLLLAQDKCDEALAQVAPLQNSEPDRPEFLTLLGQIEERRGRLVPAIAYHRQVRAAFPNYVAAANNLAYLLAQSTLDGQMPAGQRAAALSEAREQINWALQQQPGAVALNDTLGWIQVLAGDQRAGIRTLAKAAPALRLDPAVHYHLGIAYLRAGESELARMHLRNVKNLAEKRTTVPEVGLATEALATLK